MEYTSEVLELDARRVEALIYVERGLYVAESLLSEFFEQEAIASNRNLMAMYFDAGRVMVGIVQDYLHRANKVLEGKRDTESKEGANDEH